MSDEDRVCDDCKKEISKISKEQKKQEFSEQLNELADKSIEYKTKWNKDGML